MITFPADYLLANPDLSSREIEALFAQFDVVDPSDGFSSLSRLRHLRIPARSVYERHGASILLRALSSVTTAQAPVVDGLCAQMFLFYAQWADIPEHHRNLVHTLIHFRNRVRKSTCPEVNQAISDYLEKERTAHPVSLGRFAGPGGSVWNLEDLAVRLYRQKGSAAAERMPAQMMKLLSLQPQIDSAPIWSDLWIRAIEQVLLTPIPKTLLSENHAS